MLRKKNFGISNQHSNSTFIDSADKLRLFAESRGLWSIPVDVESIAKAMGIHVQFVVMLGNISGKLEKEIGGAWTIFVNRDHSPSRHRYTIAHELGHYCLHSFQETLFEDQIFFRGKEPTKNECETKTEWQANSFANEILMPEDKFIEFVDNGIEDIDILAKKFNVSTMAVRIRAKMLGFSGHGL